MTTRISRRDLLRAAAFALSGVALGACRPLSRFESQSTSADARPLRAGEFVALGRLTYGPAHPDTGFVAQHGLEAWIEAQLAFENIDDVWTDIRLLRFDTLGLAARDIRDWSAALFDAVDAHAAVTDLRSATLLRQLHSRRQLYETLVEFWSDHFNIYVDKGDCWFLKTVDDREVIRPRALGNFGELLLASARSPAMLAYLDNQANRAGAVNENYARELLELHTLGVSGGYSQSDVLALAHVLTGWRYRDDDDAFAHGTFEFDAEAHQGGAHTVLGTSYAFGDQRDGEAVIARLATHPATARRLARKLAARLIGDRALERAHARVIEASAQAFLASGGEIRALLRPLLFDGLATLACDDALPRKAKRPLNIMTSALRALQADSDAGPALLDRLTRMGQPAFGWPMPDGYPDDDGSWLDSQLPVWQFAVALADDGIAGTRVDWDALTPADAHPAQRLDALTARLFGAALPDAARDALLNALADDLSTPMLVAALLAGPAFRWC
jgi:uncharacterized protein (DUF1800 family)